jgi:hypothetical protein
MWLFTKPDDERQPVVLCMGGRKEAQERLKKIVFGYGMVGQWDMAKLSNADRRRMMKKFEVDTLYTLPKE